MAGVLCKSTPEMPNSILSKPAVHMNPSFNACTPSLNNSTLLPEQSAQHPCMSPCHCRTFLPSLDKHRQQHES